MSSPRGRRRGRDAPHVVVDVGDADSEELGRLRLADGALREGAQAEPGRTGSGPSPAMAPYSS